MGDLDLIETSSASIDAIFSFAVSIIGWIKKWISISYLVNQRKGAYARRERKLLREIGMHYK